jgi:transcriptional regulator with XRE-family HTH domain
LAFPPPKEKVAKTLSAYANALNKGNLAAFARLLGIGYRQVVRLCQGNNIPQLDTLLQICDCLGTSLLGFLTEEVITTNFDMLTSQQPNQQQLKKQKRVTGHGKICDSEQVQRVLQAALSEFPPRSLTAIAKSLGYKGCSSLFYHCSDLCHQISAQYAEYQKAGKLEEIQHALEAVLESQEYPPPPLHEVAKRLGISVPALNRHCPELCNAIAARRASYRQQCQMKRVQKLRQEVRQVAFKLNAEGIEPTASRISLHLTKPGAILQKEAVAAVLEVRRELGWEN